jgi:8-oxo-dGTP pyrophosphatase MutT (NUDIX family)
MNNVSASGFVVYRDLGKGNIVFLGLIALPYFQKKNHGMYDIPKGQIDKNETPMKAALREAKEEAGLTINSIDAGPFVHDRMSLWLAECFQEPTIGINPSTGVKEHLGFDWVKPEVMEAQCLDYLRPAITWARKYLGDI